MAAVKLSDDLSKDLLCPVCLDLFKEPVILECGHNFCQSCIDKTWDSVNVPSCPECRQEFPSKKYTINRLLSKIVETAQRAQQCEEARKPQQEQKIKCALRSQECSEHEEVLKVFCQEDGSPICLVCMISSKHTGHTFLPLQEAVNLFQDKLKIAEATLQLKINHLNEHKSKQEQYISGIQDEAQSLEQNITSEFAKLHTFLQDKEQQLIQQLWEETIVILEKMNENLRKIEEKIEALQRQIPEIQSRLQQEDPLNFLMGVMDEIERVMKGQEKEDGANVALVSENLSPGIYKGPLQYTVWKEMLSVVNPGLSHLTLDPITAHPCLILYDNLTSVKNSGISQKLPDSPQRFDFTFCVLSSEGFTSGRHYWEVEVQKRNMWTVGVTKKSSQRKGSFLAKPEAGYWGITMTEKNEYLIIDSICKHLSLSVKPKKIGVYLDYEGGQVSFYNASNMSHLYSFSDTFIEKLYPFFYVAINYRNTTADPLKLFHLKV